MPRSSPHSPLLVILQPTSFCNIDCRYCYLPSRSETARMSFDTLGRIFTWITESMCGQRDLEVVWHSGEPLVVGVEYYRQAFEIIRQAAPQDVSVQHVIQTNATLITPEWCALFQDHAVSIGVSLDGPAKMHDAFRVDRKGRGTFARTAAGIALLQQHAIPLTVLTVLTAESLFQADAIWQCYRDLGIRSVAFNIEEVEGVHQTSSLQKDAMEDRYRQFLRRILELWIEQPPQERLRVRELEWFLGSVDADRATVGAQTNTPFDVLSFDSSGRVSTFSPELLASRHPVYGDFTFGDVRKDSFATVSASPAFLEVSSSIRDGVTQCMASCEYFPLCGGGPPVNKLCENGSFASTETMYCRLRIKATADEMLTFFESQLNLSES